MPCISVIVPTRKRNHLLPRALESLFRQTWRDFEIVLVDDNPEDMRVISSPVLQSFLEDPRICLVQNTSPRSAAVARNLGLRKAKGEWVTYLDDDDAYCPQKLEKQLFRARETGLPIGLCGLAYHLKGRRRMCQISQNFFCGDELLLDASPDTKSIFHRNDRNVFFNENLLAAEDLYFFHSLVKHWKCDQVFNIPEPLIDVFPQPGPRVNTNATALALANHKIYQDFAAFYTPEAAEVFLARAKIQDWKFRSGPFTDVAKYVVRLIELRGRKDLRFVLNACLYKVPFLRNWIKT